MEDRGWGRNEERVPSSILNPRHGLVFSVGLTLFPAALVTFLAIGGLLFR
jgi:hypothetical protein